MSHSLRKAERRKKRYKAKHKGQSSTTYRPPNLARSIGVVICNMFRKLKRATA